ncbi:hypothetical protein D4R78_00535 [bacterium]|nr:MAG: hypothetical protein D4R78_00535 [bacterium]
MRLLLHICCSPCLIYPLSCLRDSGFQLSGIFYNPNIHGLLEYNNRKKEVVEFSRKENLEVIYAEYRPVDFFRAVNLQEAQPQRCQLCWALRLKATARAAKEKGFGLFSTTLLVSPYQDQEALRKAGEGAAEKEGVDFYYADFRVGFRQAHDLAKARGIYCQKYCGCIYSQVERYKKKEGK